MSFTRRMKYGNLMITRQFKRNFNSIDLETLAIMALSGVVLFTMKTAFMTI
jgi:hypothetical protein